MDFIIRKYDYSEKIMVQNFKDGKIVRILKQLAFMFML
jgi:hypothetical protein